jgi:hypothetical protein
MKGYYGKKCVFSRGKKVSVTRTFVVAFNPWTGRASR